jgi:hypothetical protein
VEGRKIIMRGRTHPPRRVVKMRMSLRRGVTSARGPPTSVERAIKRIDTVVKYDQYESYGISIEPKSEVWSSSELSRARYVM